MQDIVKHWSILSLIGPKHLIAPIKKDMLRLFNKVVLVTTPADAGDFPDTSGYTSDDWEDYESDCEDPALWRSMQKAMDATMDYVDKKYEFACDRYMGEINKTINWPKFGGQVSGVTGHVTVESGSIVLVH